jgi:hypothetical protein
MLEQRARLRFCDKLGSEVRKESGTHANRGGTSRSTSTTQRAACIARQSLSTTNIPGPLCCPSYASSMPSSRSSATTTRPLHAPPPCSPSLPRPPKPGPSSCRSLHVRVKDLSTCPTPTFGPPFARTRMKYCRSYFRAAVVEQDLERGLVLFASWARFKLKPSMHRQLQGVG